MTDPMESLAVLSVPHQRSFEHWFKAAVSRKDHELAMEVSDRARRHRFFSTLPLGGRLESLRWVLEARKELLPQQAMLQRQDLLVRYPIYKDLHDQAEGLRRDVAALPPLARRRRDRQEAEERHGPAGRRSAASRRSCSAKLPSAASRPSSPFRPLRTTAEIQKSLPPGHALLVFFATSENIHAFLLNRDKYADWQIAGTPQAIALKTKTLLRKLGNVARQLRANPTELADTHWRKDAGELLDALLKGTHEVDLGKKFDELVVVPDGPLWYVPFEALQVKVDGQLQPLISRFRVRYSPTAGWRPPTRRSAIVAATRPSSRASSAPSSTRTCSTRPSAACASRCRIA